MSRIAAFFDIDGTIYREGLITEVFKKIIKYELVDKEKWENEVRPAYISWDKRQGDYDTYLLKMVDIYMEAIIGTRVNQKIPSKYNLLINTTHRNSPTFTQSPYIAYEIRTNISVSKNSVSSRLGLM